MQPVENIVDLLAFYLGVDAMSEKLIAGLRNTGALEPTRRGESKSLNVTGAHLSFNLHDALLCEGARLDHRDRLGREVCKDFLTKTNRSVRGARPLLHLNTAGLMGLRSESPGSPRRAR